MSIETMFEYGGQVYKGREIVAFEAGRQMERALIIDKLENPVTMSNWWSQVDKNLGLYGNLKNYVIALIKGDDNDL